MFENPDVSGLLSLHQCWRGRLNSKGVITGFLLQTLKSDDDVSLIASAKEIFKVV